MVINDERTRIIRLNLNKKLLKEKLYSLNEKGLIIDIEPLDVEYDHEIFKNVIDERDEMKEIYLKLNTILKKLGYEFDNINMDNKLRLLEKLKIQSAEMLEQENKKRRLY